MADFGARGSGLKFSAAETMEFGLMNPHARAHASPDGLLPDIVLAKGRGWARYRRRVAGRMRRLTLALGLLVLGVALVFGRGGGATVWAVGAMICVWVSGRAGDTRLTRLIEALAPGVLGAVLFHVSGWREVLFLFVPVMALSAEGWGAWMGGGVLA